MSDIIKDDIHQVLTYRTTCIHLHHKTKAKIQPTPLHVHQQKLTCQIIP